MEILIFPEAEVPAELRMQVLALQSLAWPGEPPAGPEPIHDPALAPLSLLLVENRRVLSALDILNKTLRHAGEDFQASGISCMVTQPEDRSRGLGRLLAASARETMQANGADLGIFTCDRPLRRFYQSCGWSELPGAVLIGGTPAAPFPSSQFDKATMACFFSDKARRLASRFEDCEIALHPGDIDRLW